jgi:hypothetical protein
MFRDLIAKLAKKADSDLMLAMESKPLDPGLRRDDGFVTSSVSNVIPAQAGIQ